jgi:hypothetical protein
VSSEFPVEDWDWLLVGEGFEFEFELLVVVVVLVGGDGEVVVVRGGGGERILLGVILTMGLMWFGIVEGGVCLASGEGVDDRVASSGRQPGVSAISRSGLCWVKSKRGRGGCLGVTSNLVTLEGASSITVFTRLRGASSVSAASASVRSISSASSRSATLLRGLSHFPSERW